MMVKLHAHNNPNSDSTNFPSELLSKGKGWSGSKRPNGLALLTPKQCFKNAQNLVVKDHSKGRARYTYVEGYACSGSLGFALPVHHGWVIDEDGFVIDQTWEEAESSTYFGVPVITTYLIKKVEKHGLFTSVFNNPKDRHSKNVFDLAISFDDPRSLFTP